MKKPYKIMTSAAMSALLVGMNIPTAFAEKGDFYDLATNTRYSKEALKKDPKLVAALEALLEKGNVVKEIDNKGTTVDYNKAAGSFLKAIADKKQPSQALLEALKDSKVAVDFTKMKDAGQESELKVQLVNPVADITAVNGTLADKLGLPTTVAVTLSDGKSDSANVTWDTSKFVPTQAGKQVITGTLAVPADKKWTLTDAQKQVAVNVNVEEATPVVTKNVITIKNSADLIKASAEGKLIANGQTVVTLQVQLQDENGNPIKNATGIVSVESKIDGVKSSQAEPAFDVNNEGIATLNITLNNSEVKETDTLTVTVKKCSVTSYIGKQASITLDYAAKPINGSSQTSVTRSYTATVQSADLADRVKVYVSGVLGEDAEKISKEILNNIVITTKDAFTGNKIAVHKLVKVIAEKIVNQKVTEADHVYTVLLEKEAYSSIRDYKNNVNFVLQDNSNNYYTIKDSGLEVKLAPSTEKSFMVIDGEKPRLEKVLVPTDDTNYLPANTLVAVFSEDVNRATAENPNNWVINGHNLSDIGMVNYIRQLDINEQDDLGKVLNSTGAIQQNVGDGNQRNAVVISLTPKAAKYLTNGNNLIQAKSVGDAASVTDLSDNNKILTQDFIFKYVKPEYKPALAITQESPEQFVLSAPTMYADSNATLVKALNGNTIIKLGDVDVTNYFRVVKLAEPNLTNNNDKYIMELTQDWTTIPGIDNTYHNKTLSVTLSDGYDVYGTRYDGKTGNQANLTVSTVVDEDVTSPTIATDVNNINGLKINYDSTLAYNKIKSDLEKKVIYDVSPTAGNMTITMSEPVQLINDASPNEGPVAGFSPNTTPSVEEVTTVPVTNLEYVMLDASGKSTGKIVKGKVLSVSDEHDNTFTVEPCTPLAAGDWKLVVRAISDDVGNTMKTTDINNATAAIKFTVSEGAPIVIGEPTVDPYVLWAYADDDKLNSDGTKNDYVYILYSKIMDVEALRSATYNINSKQVAQDAIITSKEIPLYVASEKSGIKKFYDEAYHPELRGQLVTIKLPANFIVGGDDIDGGDDINGVSNKAFRKNALTIPTSLTDMGGTALKLDNNNLNNQYELSFKKDYKGDAIVIGGKQVVPTIDVEASNVSSIDNYIKNEKDVSGDKASLALNYDGIAGSYILPIIGSNGSTITWAETNNGGVSKLEADGKTLTITRDKLNDIDDIVTLTATIKKGTASESKVYTITVKEAKEPVLKGTNPVILDSTKKIVTIECDETILNNTLDAATLKAAITFAGDGTTFAALGVTDTVEIKDGKLVVTFNDALSTATNKIKIAALALKDANGNANKEIVTDAIIAN